MRKIKLYIAMSLNGKITDADGNVGWLENMPNPDQSDYGYHAFYNSVDATIQGYKTYKQIIDWGIPFPYKGKTNYVLTKQTNLEDTEDVQFLNADFNDFLQKIKHQEGKDIWLIGGGQINTLLLNSGLIDELHVFVMPIILDGGINLFESIPKQTALTLVESVTYKSGAVQLRYGVKSK